MILERLLGGGGAAAEVETRSSNWWEVLLTSTSASGVVVTPSSAMTNSAVYACVRILAETVASLPLVLYRRDGRNKERAMGHGLYRVLHDRPNPLMTSFQFRETLQAHLVTWGNAYAEISYTGRGGVAELWPLNPSKMLRIETAGGRRRYEYQLPSGEVRWLDGSRVWHIPGLGFDGLYGYSPISQMKSAIGLAMATEKFGSTFFGNGARPGGVLQHPGKLEGKAHDRLKESWSSAHGGLDNANRVAILEEGMTYEQIGVPPDDAQFLQTRRFQIEEIARIYRVPPHMLADLERATFSNIEHLSIDFVVHSIRPWLVRWEQSIGLNLLTERDQRTFFAEFLVDGLLRGDVRSRHEAYAIGRQNGWLSANDVRQLENMNPIDGGDTYLIPLNMVPAEAAGRSAVPADDAGEDLGERGQESNGERRDQAVLDDREARVSRSVAVRRRLMMSHRRLYQDVAGRIIRRETHDLMQGAKKNFRSRGFTDFSAWLDSFFEEHQEFIREQMSGLALSYAELIAAAAADEVEFEDLDEKRLRRFVKRYMEAYASRHVIDSEARIETVLARAQADGADPVEELEAEFEHWRSVRPAEIARAEATRVAGAVSVLAYELAGVIKLIWRAFGESCPYCSHLDGRVVGIEEFYLMAGEDFEPEGAESPLRPRRNVRHPPAHRGCDCLVSSSG